ncbi:MAG: peptidylprolyl isomerase [Bacteroidota bacterium]|nr:peptidylprolyl isomerase [Bacteroidota bacterium]
MRVLHSVLIFIIGQSIMFGQLEFSSKELPKDTLATIGSQIISAKDFLERFELMPWPKKDVASRVEYTKLEFLQSMVAEKILAMESRQQNIGTDSTTMSLQQNLERLFVRDEFYKREVLPKISAPPGEIFEGMKRIPYESEVVVMGILSQKEGELLRKKIIRSKNKSATFNFFIDSLYVPLDTITVGYGFGDKTAEDVVFSIGKDSVSSPVEIDPLGWVMFRLLQKKSNDQLVRLSHPDRLRKVENIIRQRKEDSIATKVFASVTSPQKAEANPELFYMLADSILAMMKTDSAAYFSKGMYIFSSTAIAELQKKFTSRLNDAFITIASGNMSVDDVLISLGNNSVAFPSLKPEQVQSVLNNNIKTVIQNELLTREGLKKNLHQTENVRHDISTWLDNRKSMLLIRSVLDTVQVSKDEIELEYQLSPQKYGASIFVRLREILVDSISFAKELRERINKKEDFSTLAKKYSKRKDWEKNGGESPWIEVNKWGDLGVYASNAKLNEISGPLKITGGFTIFSVIEKKIVDDSIRANFFETSHTIEQKLLNEKRLQVMNSYIGTLAKKYNVTMNEEALRNIKTTTTNMFTWRNLGFGGRIVAVPQVVRQTDWVYEWMKQKQLNQ